MFGEARIKSCECCDMPLKKEKKPIKGHVFCCTSCNNILELLDRTAKRIFGN